MSGAGAGGEMPAGDGCADGLHPQPRGTDLTNDHPISLTFDTTLAVADGELRDPATSDPKSGCAARESRPLFPLEATGPAGAAQLQCASCHDPHLAGRRWGRPRTSSCAGIGCS